MKDSPADARYRQALDYVNSFSDSETSLQPRKAENFDLRRVAMLLGRLGNPHLDARTVHIAGTKGKGSAAAMVASVLIKADYRTGLYTSPHLIDVRERIRLDGRMIPREAFAAGVERLKPQVAAVNREAAFGKLTTFELLTALAFLHFSTSGADFQVIETGLGGRLDATNVVNPEVSVITSISLDHTEVLGNTIEKIAAEKAGIIKTGTAVVSAPQAGEAARVIEKTCLEKGSKLVQVGRDVTWEGSGLEGGRQLVLIRGRLAEYRLSLPLAGLFQQENAAVAVAALEILVEKGFNIPIEAIACGLGSVEWPGRFQVIGNNPPIIILDGAHNPYSARELARSLRECYLQQGNLFGKPVLVFGTSLDKDIGGMAGELSGLFDIVIATRSRHPRAMAVEDVSLAFKKYGAEVLAAGTIAGALDMARQLAGESGLVCVTGSLFVVGEAMELLSLPV